MIARWFQKTGGSSRPSQGGSFALAGEAGELPGGGDRPVSLPGGGGLLS